MASAIVKPEMLRKAGIRPGKPSFAQRPVKKAAGLTPMMAAKAAPGELLGSMAEIAGNVPSSALELGKGIVSTVAHPIQAWRGVTGLASGLGSKMSEMVSGKPMPKEAELVPGGREALGAVGELVKERYGSLGGLQKTIEHDPVGFASDVAGLLSGGGSLLSAAGKAGKLGKVSKLGGALGDLASKVDPVTASVKVLGEAGTRAAQKMATPFAKHVDVKVREAVERLQVPAPPSAMSKSPVAQILESIGGKGLFGGDIVEQYERASTKLVEASERLVQEAGPRLEKAAIGKRLLDNFKRYRDDFYTAKDVLYAKARIPKPGESGSFVIEAPKAKAMLDEMIEVGKAGGYARSELSSLEDLSKALGRKPSAFEVRARIQRLNAMMGDFDSALVRGEQARLRKIAKQLHDEFDAALALERPELAKSLEEANRFYKEGSERLESRMAGVLAANKETPSEIFDSLFNEGLAVEEIPLIFELVGTGDVPKLQAAMLDSLLFGKNGALSARAAIPTMQPGKIEGWMRKMGDEKLGKLLTEKQIKTLEDIEAAAKGLSRSSKVASGSQTFFLSKIFGMLHALGVGNPILAAQMVVGDLLLNKFLMSQAGKKALLEGFPEWAKRAEDGRVLLESLRARYPAGLEAGSRLLPAASEAVEERKNTPLDSAR